MTQLVELQERARAFEAFGLRAQLVALVEDDKKDTGGRDVRPLTAFSGRILLDEDERVLKAFGLTYGSVALIDPEGRVRWRKPGSAYKRPRAQLVAESVAAFLERAADPGVVAPLLAALEEDLPAERAAAARRLGELEAPEAREGLERVATNAEESARTRREALRSLGRLRDPRSLDAAAAIAADPAAPRDVRAAAAGLLVGYGDDFDPPAGTNWRPRWTSAESRELTARRATLLPAAEALLDEKTSDLRRQGAALLARLRHEDAFEPLMALTDDRDALVREYALTGLCEWREDERVQTVAREHERDRGTDVKRVARYVLDGPVGKLRE